MENLQKIGEVLKKTNNVFDLKNAMISAYPELKREHDHISSKEFISETKGFLANAEHEIDNNYIDEHDPVLKSFTSHLSDIAKEINDYSEDYSLQRKTLEQLLPEFKQKAIRSLQAYINILEAIERGANA